MSQVILQLWTNNAVSLLQNSIGAGDVTLTVQPGLGAKFPQPANPGEFFLITLEDVASPVSREIIKVTGRSGDVLTGLVRGWESTTAQSWPAGDTLVDHRITAATVHQSFIYGGQDGGNVSALNNIAANGIYVITSPTTSAARSIVSSNPLINIANGDGVAGNPTISLDLGTANQILGMNAGGTALEYKTINAGSNVSVVHGAGTITISSTGGGGGGSALELYAENPVTPSAPSATGTNAVAIGQASAAQAPNSIALGPQSLTRTEGQLAWTNGRFASSGDAQFGRYALRASTINGAATPMFIDGPGGSISLALPDDATWSFKATVTAHRTDAGDGHAGFELKGVIYRGAGAATTALQGKVSSQIIARSNTSWNVVATADATTGALKLTVQGQNGKTIRWLAVVETVEITN